MNSPWKYQPWFKRSFIAQQNKREYDPIVNLNSKIGRLRAESPSAHCFVPCPRGACALSSIQIEEANITGRFYLPMKKPVPSLLNTPGPEIDTRNKTNRIIQQSIARGHDDLANGRVQPWKQAKAEADRMRAPSQSSPHVTIL